MLTRAQQLLQQVLLRQKLQQALKIAEKRLDFVVLHTHDTTSAVLEERGEGEKFKLFHQTLICLLIKPFCLEGETDRQTDRQTDRKKKTTIGVSDGNS
jgi:hypothetical protein